MSVVTGEVSSPSSTTTTPSPDNPSTWTIDTGTNVDDIVLSSDQQAAIQRFEARKTLITSLIDTLIPDRPLKEYYKDIADRYKKTITAMDDEDRGEAQNAFKTSRFNKQQLVDTIAQSEADEGELEPYITALHSTAQILTPSNKEVSYYLLTGLLNAAQSVEQARLHQQLAIQWRDRFLEGVDDKTLMSRAGDFQGLITAITGCNLYPRPEPKTSEETTRLFLGLSDIYSYTYSLPEENQNNYLVRKFTSTAERISLAFNDPEQGRRMMKLYKKIESYPDHEVLKSFTEAITRYSINHGLTEEAIEGFTEKLLPAIQNKDLQIEILLRGGNIWGVHKGDFGVGDFLTHSYAVKVNPSNINELLIAAREIPSTNLARLEQNRLDALTMATPFGILRDFIHDQRPYVHEVLEAMVHYYDTGDRKKLESVLPKTDYFNTTAERQNMLFDREKYDMEIEEKTKDRHSDGQNKKVKSVEVLRRLVENTKPIPDLPPITSDDELNRRLQTLAEAKTGTNTSRATLASTVDFVNASLVEAMDRGDVGIEPNHILALSWLERRGFEALQGIQYEDQMGAYNQDWFISLLKLQELTSSPHDFSESQFNDFIAQLKNTSSSIEAYKMVNKRTLNHVSALARKYKESEKTDTGALWSGNMAHEFIGLVDYRPAITALGERAREENIRRLVEPGYHPGD